MLTHTVVLFKNHSIFGGSQTLAKLQGCSEGTWEYKTIFLTVEETSWNFPVSRMGMKQRSGEGLGRQGRWEEKRAGGR